MPCGFRCLPSWGRTYLENIHFWISVGMPVMDFTSVSRMRQLRVTPFSSWTHPDVVAPKQTAMSLQHRTRGMWHPQRGLCYILLSELACRSVEAMKRVGNQACSNLLSCLQLLPDCRIRRTVELWQYWMPPGGPMGLLAHIMSLCMWLVYGGVPRALLYLQFHHQARLWQSQTRPCILTWMTRPASALLLSSIARCVCPASQQAQDACAIVGLPCLADMPWLRTHIP